MFKTASVRPGFKTRHSSDNHSSHHRKYCTASRASSHLSYLFRRLYGGSAKQKSTELSGSPLSPSRQSLLMRELSLGGLSGTLNAAAGRELPFAASAGSGPTDSSGQPR